MIADLVAERAPIGAELSPRATPCIMLSLIPSSSFNLVAGLAPQPQMRSSVAMALDRPIKVAVIGGGPSGACAAEIFAKVHCCPANHRERGLRASLTSSGPPKTLHRVAVRLAGPPQPQSPAPGVRSTVPDLVRKAAFALEVGELSDLIHSDMGGHILLRTA